MSRRSLAPQSVRASLQFHAIVAAIVVAALIGSAAPLEARAKTGKITYRDLVPGGLAIVGVTSVVEGPTSERDSRKGMSRIFQNIFLETRRDIPLMGSDRVRSAVGLDSYESMLDHFQATGEVAAPELAALRVALVDSIRYVVVARLEKEKVNRYTSEVDPDNDPDTKNTIVKTATRTIEAGFRVYDLRDGTLAWSTRQSCSVENETSAPAGSRLFKSSTVAGMLETVLSDEKGPADPRLADAFANLPEIFGKFASKLPGKKK